MRNESPVPSSRACALVLLTLAACGADAEQPKGDLSGLTLVADDIGNRPLATLPGLYRYVFTDFDSVNNSVLKSQRIGFAFPLRGDQFIVVRFDLDGAFAALRTMRAAAAARIQPGRRTTFDQKL